MVTAALSSLGPREELAHLCDHIVAEATLIEDAAVGLIATTTGVVGQMYNATVNEGWAEKYITAKGPAGELGHHSRPEAIDGFIFNSGKTPFDARLRAKMAAYEALIPEYRKKLCLRNVDNISFFDIESTGVGTPYMNFFGFLPVGTDGLSIYKLGYTRVDYYEYVGPRENPGRQARWTPIFISLYGNLSPSLYAPVYRPDGQYWGFFDVHWNLPGLMADTIEKSLHNLLVIAHDPEYLGGNSILIGINRQASSVTGIKGFAPGLRNLEKLMLEKDERKDVRELAAKIKGGGKDVFAHELGGRPFDIYALHEPNMLRGLTLVRMDQRLGQ